MKYVQVNSVPHGSTGSIMMGLHGKLLDEGVDSYVCWGRGRSAENGRELKFGADLGFYGDVLRTRFDGRAGFHSRGATRRLLAWLDEIDPDVVHLHNIHGYYVNIEMLFEWLASHRCRVKWTLHDCWAFTGHCAHFTYAKCAQWQSHCAHEKPCPQLGTYPKTYSRRSCARNFEDKRRLFNLVPPERMELITPSKWLADLVGQSFLSKYSVTVKHNEIDLSVFKPTPSDFRERYGIGDRFMILGVASPWTERKGLGDFVRLAGELDEHYVIVLVGLNKRQIKRLPKQIIGLQRMGDPERLAEAYTAADIFVNPSIEETFGMTVAEAAACGTPVAVCADSACMEASEDADRRVVAADLSNLFATVVRAGGGCLVMMIERTSRKDQLAAIYTSADIFFNPTREDNYPTVNLEAQACGTPVMTYDVGGCRETVAAFSSCNSDNRLRNVVILNAGSDAVRSFAKKLAGIKIDIEGRRHG